MDQLDPQAVSLAKSIRHVESGGDFQSQGKSGEYGAYQFTEPTWDNYSKQYGINVPLKQSTPQQQNEVAYKKIKEWKDQGKNVGEIASMWNAGEGKPDAYLKGNSGTNDKGVHYDTAGYAKNVATTYQQLKQQNGGYNPKPFSQPDGVSPFTVDTSGATPLPTPETKSDTLGSELNGRVGDFSQAISDYSNKKQGLISTGLQTVGAVAGGIGDVVNKGLELIPGVKSVEGLIGKGVGKLAQTDTGQQVIKGVKDFSANHPVAAKNIEAGLNIATAIPILKGVGVAKDIAMDGASLALKKVAENTVEKDITATLGRTVGGRQAIKSTPQAVKTLITERALPDIAENKYATKEAYEKLSESISQVEDNELQPTLKSVSTSGVNTKVPIKDLRQQALDNVKEEFKSGGNVGKAESEVNRIFDDYRNNYGDYVSLEDVNDMKRGIRTTVNFASPKLDSDVSYHLGQVFQKSIEDSAAKLSLADVGEINGRMARLIQAQNLLKHIEGKPIKQGLTSGIIKDAATIGGEAAGNATGIPFAGAYIGREVGGRIGNKLTGISKGILDRTGKDAVRTSLKSAAKKSAGLLIGTNLQKINKK